MEKQKIKKFKAPEGIPLKAIQNKTIGDILKIEKQFRRISKIK